MRLVKKGITTGRINRFFALFTAIFLALAAFLYWQNHISLFALIVTGILGLAVVVLFVFGVRISQRDGFLDGYARAKDNFDKKKKG